jgi:hypothetical protein
MGKKCPECYSDDPRATPLLGPEDCLRKHTQYVCATCGRCICADVGKGGKARWWFPFKTSEIAQLYIRAGEVISGGPCAIYEFESSTGRRFVKIFANDEDRDTYCKRNPDKRLLSEKPAFVTSSYKPMQDGQRRRLTDEQVTQYLREKSN